METNNLVPFIMAVVGVVGWRLRHVSDSSRPFANLHPFVRIGLDGSRWFNVD